MGTKKGDPKKPILATGGDCGGKTHVSRRVRGPRPGAGPSQEPNPGREPGTGDGSPSAAAGGHGAEDMEVGPIDLLGGLERIRVEEQRLRERLRELARQRLMLHMFQRHAARRERVARENVHNGVQGPGEDHGPG